MTGSRTVKPIEKVAQTDWLEHIGYGCIVLDDAGTILFANARIRSLIPDLAAVGGIFWKLLPEGSTQGVDRYLKEARQSGRVVKFDQFIEELGRWYSVSVHPLPESLLLFVRDTSSTSEQDYRTRALMQFSSDGLLLLNADYSVQFHRSLFSDSEEDDGPVMFPERVPAADWDRVASVIRQLGPGENTIVRFRFRVAGDDKFLEATVSNRLRDPSTRALVFNYRDITAERLATEAIASREASLEELTASLELREQRLARLHKVARITARSKLTLDEMLTNVMSVVAPNGEVAARVFVKHDERMRRAADSERPLFSDGSPQDLETSRVATLAFDSRRSIVLYTENEPGLSALKKSGVHSVQAIPFNKSGVKGASVALFRYRLAQEPDVRPYTETVADFVTGAVANRHLIEQLERSASDSHALARFGHSLESMTEASELIVHAVNSLYDQLGLRLAVFAEVKGDYLVPRVVLGARNAEEQNLAMRPLPVNQGMARQVLADRLPVLVPDYTNMQNAQKHMIGFGLRSAVALPIVNGNTVEYVMLGGHAQTDRQFNQTELSIASLFTQRLASALQRVSYLNEIRSTRDATFRALGQALEHRDYETHGHTDRVTVLMDRFAEVLDVPPRFRKGLIWGAYLHDLGKLSLSDEILLKPGPLTDEEFAVVRKHTLVGADMCRDIPFLPQTTLQIVRSHHERWDGSGYPDRLAGTDIPLPARMFALVDVFDALTSERVYKQMWSLDEAIAEIEGLSGSHFDPSLVPEFIKLIQNPD